MIDVPCGCASFRRVSEASVDQRIKCPACDRDIHLVCGEALSEGAGAGDFDAGLIVRAGPRDVGTHLVLGGVADVSLGKLPACHVVLPGTLVSRQHCRLVRVDFGPSRWKLVDCRSTNGLFVNGERITERELHDGDIVRVGEYEFQYKTFEAPAPKPASKLPAVSPIAAVGGPICPSCNQSLASTAKICIDCGVHVNTGRPVLTSQDVDENILYEAAYQWIRWISLLVWITPMPIPIRSQAFGTRKPYAIWTIAAATTLASLLFFVAQNSGSGRFDRPYSNLMLWPPGASEHHTVLSSSKIRQISSHLSRQAREELRNEFEHPGERLTDTELVERAAESISLQIDSSRGEFHPYQLLTHAFLHDTSSLYGFAMHLAGNMLFLLVFGTRVNALIGNIATAVLYPVLAICAAAGHLLMIGSDASTPMLGASGAIMGLAGMYLILFPAHKVFCAMWFSLWLRFWRYFGCKIFQMRGFWLLLIYFGYDLLMNAITSRLGGGGGVAHGAHIGGFVTGMILGLGILVSRLFNTHGGDVLSVTLGKHAWPLIGKPSRWRTPAFSGSVAM